MREVGAGFQHPSIAHHPFVLRFSFFVICLLGFAVRLWAASGEDVGLDGGLSVALAFVPLPDALRFYAHDVHPPLYYLALRPWLGLAGTSPLAVKYLGVLVGTLALAVLMAWVRSLVGGASAVVVGLLGAIAPVWVIVDVTAREYGLAVLLLTATGWAYTRWSRPARVAFVALGVLAVWTSYLTVVVPAVVGAIGLIRRDRRRVVAAAVVGCSIVPWLSYAFAQGFAATVRSNGPRQSAVVADPVPVQARDLVRFLTAGPTLDPSWLGPVLVLVAILLLIGARRLSATPSRSKLTEVGAFLAGVFIAGGVLALAINTAWTRQGLGIRFVAPLIPVALAGLGIGIAPLLARARAWAVLVVALIGVPGALGLQAWVHRPPNPGYFWDPDALVRFLDARVQPDDSLVFVWPEQAGYYQMLSAHPRRWALIPTGVDYLQGDAAARARATLPPLTRDSRIVWLVLYRQVLGTGTSRVGDWLSFNAFAATPVALADSDVAPYVASPPSASPDPVDAPFQEGIRLLSASWDPTLRPGAVASVDLRWEGQAETRRNLRVFVHLVDPAGRTVAQHDGVPANARAPVPQWPPGRVVDDRHGLLLPPDLTPGPYWLEIGLYDDAGRLPLVSGGDTVRLGPIEAGGA